MRTLAPAVLNRTVRLAVAYDSAADDAANEEGTDETFVIPEDFADLDDSGLTELHSKAVEAFNAVYGDGTGLTDDHLATLAQLGEGIESLSTEVSARESKAAERAEQARALAAKVNPNFASESEEGEEGEEGSEEETEETEGEEGEEETDSEGEGEGESVQASANGKPRRALNINLGNMRNRKPAPAPSKGPKTGDYMLDADGAGTDFGALSNSLARQLQAMPQSQYAMAASRGQHLRQQNSLAVLRKPFTDEDMITSNDAEHVAKVMDRAVDQTRLEGGSLVAAGGWCAPSTTLYDFLELEGRDGLLSLPEVGVTRGGINFTQGPDFGDIFENTGFSYTEAEDIAGDYDGNGGGSKPFYEIECPDFDEERLAIAGLAINAGLLKLRAYPEVIQRVIRGALVAHDHKMSATLIGSLADGSDAVTMPAPQVGTIAPILNSIELQVQHYRTKNRLARNANLEAVFPMWTHGAVRGDLARMGEKDLLSVTDNEINAWFRQRGINPQFVYNWQSIDAESAGEFTAWPTEVSFLLYAAGTWVRGSSDIITLETIYDSVNLGQNNYTALFTEEGWLTAKRGHDSRLVTVPIETTGTRAGEILIGHDGTPAAPAEDAPVDPAA